MAMNGCSSVEPSPDQRSASGGFTSDTAPLMTPINEDETKYTNIQVHPDPTSMEIHMQVLNDNWDETFSRYGDNVEGIKVECYGGGCDTGWRPVSWRGRRKAGRCGHSNLITSEVHTGQS